MDNLPVSPEFLTRVKQFREEWYNRLRSISEETTPQIDGTGHKIVNRRPDGYDYIEETYMRDMLDKHFPGWSWVFVSPLQFLGAEWVVREGELWIVDEYLLAFDIKPPIRRFLAVDSVRIQYRNCSCQGKKPMCLICKGTGKLPHTPENIIDIGDNCKQANTAALKYGINRLCRIGDDIYKKRLEHEGAGTIESLVESNPDMENFSRWITSHKGLWSEIYAILKVKDISEITDWKLAYETVKAKKGW